MITQLLSELFLDFSEIDEQIFKLRQLRDSFRKINGEQNRYTQPKSHFAPQAPVAHKTAGATEARSL